MAVTKERLAELRCVAKQFRSYVDHVWVERVGEVCDELLDEIESLSRRGCGLDDNYCPHYVEWETDRLRREAAEAWLRLHEAANEPTQATPLVPPSSLRTMIETP